MAWLDGKWGKRKCVVCGKEFEAKVKTQLTCSKECGKIHNRQQQAQRDAEHRSLKAVHVHVNTMDEIREIARKGIHYGQLVVEMERNGNQV